LETSTVVVSSVGPVVPPPKPLVKKPKREEGGEPEWRVGKGFSRGEVEAAGLTEDQARLLGIYVDRRRRTVWEVNVRALKEWLDRVLRGEISAPPPTYPKVVKIKEKSGRVHRGLTPAGRRARGLFSVRLKETHRKKWKKKQKEREEKRRHEATRAKGGH